LEIEVPMSANVSKIRKSSAAPAEPVDGKAQSSTHIDALLVTVPDPSVAARYINRKIGGHEDFHLFDTALSMKWNILMSGDTGAGKTMATMAYAASRELPFYSIPNNIAIEPSQLFGKIVPDETGETIGRWQDGPVTHMVKNGGVLLIDEVNFLPPRVATVLFSLLDGRREITLLEHNGEVIKAHPDLLIVAGMNPDYLGTSDLNAAFRNRFEMQLSWGYDPRVESKLVISSNLLNLARNMRKNQIDGTIVTPTSTNMLMEFETMVKKLGLKFAMENFVQHYHTDDRKAVREALRAIESNLETDYANLKDEEPAKAPAAASVPVQSGWEFVEDPTVKSWLGDPVGV
jgi:MoxR-like ATPase